MKPELPPIDFVLTPAERSAAALATIALEDRRRKANDQPKSGPSYAGKERAIIHVLAERDRQDQQWGGPDHDDHHSPEDWLGYISDQTVKAYRSGIPGTVQPMNTGQASPEVRERMVKIAALAVAAIESYDRCIGHE